jgi:eukaryotic-like serine/threonine-protein kinase
VPFIPPTGTELLEVIGAGSVFEVAVVRHESAVVICKRLTGRTRHEPAGRAAIIREAKALSLARHPAIPRLLHAGNDAYGPFLLETRVEGVSMRALAEGWRPRGGVPAALLDHVARSAIQVVAELHELRDEEGSLGIVHGDIGPDHVYLDPIGQVRLIDFGAARFRGMGEDLMTGDRGTLPFTAPEVARSETAPTACGDVYSLAATLLFTGSGQPLCHAKEEAAMLLEIGDHGIRLDLIEALPLSPEKREALRRALHPDAAHRTRSARELLRELDKVS